MSSLLQRKLSHCEALAPSHDADYAQDDVLLPYASVYDGESPPDPEEYPRAMSRNARAVRTVLGAADARSVTDGREPISWVFWSPVSLGSFRRSWMVRDGVSSNSSIALAQSVRPSSCYFNLFRNRHPAHSSSSTMLHETGPRLPGQTWMQCNQQRGPRFVQIRPGTARVVDTCFRRRNPPKASAAGCAAGAGHYLMLTHAYAITQDNHKYHPLTHQPGCVCMHAE
jgi:hypothetical protein